MLEYGYVNGWRLFIAQIDDLFGEAEQINVPGTSFERPNWRRKLSRDLESLAGNPELSALAEGLQEARRLGD